MTLMCKEVFAHQISLFSLYFAQTDSLSKADGDCLGWFLQKGSDSGMCLGSFWFKPVCDNSSKVLVAHFEKVLHKLSNRFF